MSNKDSTCYNYDQDIPVKMEIKNGSNKKIYKKIVKKRRTLKLWVWFLIFGILIFAIVLSFLKIFSWGKDNKDIDNIIDDVEQEYDLVYDNENTELINEPDDKNNDYWYYVTFPLIKVDFSELIKKNDDTVAWINVNNTNINYPVVQYSDNDYYLEHSYDKSENRAGWVFMDFRNNSNFDNKNTIIYAHSRVNKTMFGSLSNVLNDDWYQNKDNHIIRISTIKENSLWQIFSVYVVKSETYYIKTNFDGGNEYQEFLDTVEGRSKYDFKTNLSSDDKILTLSTCYSDTERVVVHAKLIKKEKR